MMPTPSKPQRQRRNAELYRRFVVLYEHKRMRLDDVSRRLSAEFFVSERTVLRILRELPPPLPDIPQDVSND